MKKETCIWRPIWPGSVLPYDLRCRCSICRRLRLSRQRMDGPLPGLVYRNRKGRARR